MYSAVALSRPVSLFGRFAFTALTALYVALHCRSTGHRPSLVRPSRRGWQGRAIVTGASDGGLLDSPPG